MIRHNRIVIIGVEALEFMVEANVDNFPRRTGEAQSERNDSFNSDEPKTVNDLPNPPKGTKLGMSRCRPGRMARS